jgi:hypothetical protein
MTWGVIGAVAAEVTEVARDEFQRLSGDKTHQGLANVE